MTGEGDAWSALSDHVDHAAHLLDGCDCCEPLTVADAEALASTWSDLRAAVYWEEGDAGRDLADSLFGAVEARLIDAAFLRAR